MENSINIVARKGFEHRPNKHSAPADLLERSALSNGNIDRGFDQNTEAGELTVWTGRCSADSDASTPKLFKEKQQAV